MSAVARLNEKEQPKPIWILLLILSFWISSPLALRGDLLILRFEDVRSNLEGTIARCLNFLGKTASPEIICNAVHNNTLAKMREKEDRATTLPKSPDEEGRWIGRGSIAGWRGKLTEQQLAAVAVVGVRADGGGALGVDQAAPGAAVAVA